MPDTEDELKDWRSILSHQVFFLGLSGIAVGVVLDRLDAPTWAWTATAAIGVVSALSSKWVQARAPRRRWFWAIVSPMLVGLVVASAWPRLRAALQPASTVRLENVPAPNKSDGGVFSIRALQWGASGPDRAFVTVDAHEIKPNADVIRLLLIVRMQDDSIDKLTDPVIDKSALFSVIDDKTTIEVKLSQALMKKAAPGKWLQFFVFIAPATIPLDQIRTIGDALARGAILGANPATQIPVGATGSHTPSP